MSETYTRYILKVRKDKLVFLAVITILYCGAARLTHLYLGLIYLFAIYPIYLFLLFLGIEILRKNEKNRKD